jgi:HK97 family phage prohead protease
MHRAYSLITFKSIDQEQRTITGTATTPSPDRVLDIVEPLGCVFKNPLPLLWQHRADEPVGLATFDTPTAAGITFTARIAKIDEPGTLKDRCDEAWLSIREKLCRAVSIGFKTLNNAVQPLKNGGLRYLQTEILELSLCTIPANMDAQIATVKSLDAQYLRAARRKSHPVVYLDKPRHVVVRL